MPIVHLLNKGDIIKRMRKKGNCSVVLDEWRTRFVSWMPLLGRTRWSVKYPLKDAFVRALNRITQKSQASLCNQEPKSWIITTQIMNRKEDKAEEFTFKQKNETVQAFSSSASFRAILFKWKRFVHFIFYMHSPFLINYTSNTHIHQRRRLKCTLFFLVCSVPGRS